MRIAFMIPPRDILSADGGGSVAIVTCQLAREVAARGHAVTIYARRTADQPEHEWTSEGIHIRRIQGDGRSRQSMMELLWGLLPVAVPWTMHTGYYPRFAANLASELEQAPPDVLQIPTQCQYLARFRRRFDSTRIVLHLHDELVTHLPHAHMINQVAAAHLVLCVRNHIRDRLAKRLPQMKDRIRTLHHGADLRVFSPAFGSRPTRPTLLFAGRLSPEKGVHLVAEAFARIHQRHPSAQLVLVGPAGLMPFAWVRALSGDPAVASIRRFYGKGLVERIYREIWQRGRGYLHDIRKLLGPALEATAFIPRVSFSEMPRRYREASMLLAPSVCTELPMPLWEAMASGLPVIMSYDYTAEGPFRAGETVLVAKRNDAKDLENRIAELLENPQRCADLGRQALAAIRSEGTWAIQAGKLIAAYESI